MPKKVPELTDAAVRKLKHGFIKGAVDTDSTQKRYRKKDIGEPCTAYHAVGGVAGLLLCCLPPVSEDYEGSRSWILRTTIGGKRKEIGLGAYPEVTLSKARIEARTMKEQIKAGVDPVAERIAAKEQTRAAQRKTKTFNDYAQDYIKKKSEGFKETSRFKQTQKLENQLKTYVLPIMGHKAPYDVNVTDVLKVLEPIWIEKHETASRVRIHMEGVIAMAKATSDDDEKLKYRDNPAKWENLKDTTLVEPKVIRKNIRKVEHLAALDVADLPQFMTKLSAHEGASYRVLEFIVLTAARSVEARGARWEEIDLINKVWTIPSLRMKTGISHKVPLSDKAVELLQSMTPRSTGLIFTNSKGTMLSDVSVSKIPKKFGHDVTAHGFRSTFKDWSRQPSTFEHALYDDDHTEICLSHINSASTRAAYARNEVLEERRPIMQDWAKYAYKK